MKPERKLTLQQMQQQLDMYKLSSERAHKREKFLLNIVRQFHREVESWGLELESQATKDSMCIFAGDWQCSIDMHLEAAKRQDGE